MLLQGLEDVAAAERAGALLGALALGLQRGQVGKATQHDHLVEHANVGKPAAQQLALRAGRGGKGLHVGGSGACGAKGQGHGGEFVIHGGGSGQRLSRGCYKFSSWWRTFYVG